MFRDYLTKANETLEGTLVFEVQLGSIKHGKHALTGTWRAGIKERPDSFRTGATGEEALKALLDAESGSVVTKEKKA